MSGLFTILVFLWSNVGSILEGLSALIGGAAMLAALTPTPRDDAALAWMRRVLDLIACNFGNASNMPPGLDAAVADLGAAIGGKPVNLSLAANALLAVLGPPPGGGR
ncbi:hypothetical protein WCLP8_1880010 [uncultured Gammaproteobacteria bacterium]